MAEPSGDRVTQKQLFDEIRSVEGRIAATLSNIQKSMKDYHELAAKLAAQATYLAEKVEDADQEIHSLRIWDRSLAALTVISALIAGILGIKLN